MMAEKAYDKLAEEVVEYETQLSQVVQGLKDECSENKAGLIALRDQFVQLISLTKEQMIKLKPSSGENIQSTSSIETEEQIRNALAKSEALMEDLKKDFAALEGVTCQAPLGNPFVDCEYHNAIIYRVEDTGDASIETVLVRVFFTNPVSRNMVPCENYLSGKCKYSAVSCWFSHGRLVPLSELREYRGPDFSAVEPGTNALVKQNNKIWAPATVLSVSPDATCNVKFENTGYETTVDLKDILPSGTSKTNEEPFVFTMERRVKEEASDDPPPIGFGEWEKHTKGIGSRLMAQMGYITGSGLGKHGDGIIEPVEAMSFPVGKSLDHCMILKAKANGNKDLFNVNRRMEKLKKKEEKRVAQYKKSTKEKDFFGFLNDQLSGQPEPSSAKKDLAQTPQIAGPSNLRTQSSHSLNVTFLKISEEIRRAEKSLAHIDKSLSRHNKGTFTHRKLLEKYEEKKKEIMSLKSSESVINKERNQRNDHKKMTSF